VQWLARIRARNDAPGVLPSLPTRALAILLAPVFSGCASVKSQSSSDAAAGDTAAPMDMASNGEAPADTSAPAERPTFDLSGGDRPPPAPGKVYAHSDSTLWLLEPISKQVTMVGMFDCVATAMVSAMVDIAIDRTGRMTGSAALPFNGGLGGALVTIDPTDAHCTVLTRGPELVTSLTYVPEGTLVANAETLVGYADDKYVRVDPTNGTLTEIGLLNNAASGGITWFSSGDVVSIKDGGTYLTVKAGIGNPGPGGDRIVEVDPKTGALKRIIGPTGSVDVLGLGYWGGIAYGFTLAGTLIQIDLTTGAGTPIAIPGAPAGLAFYGAGTTTIATIIVE
jgi:hypothetical protein